ncbi:MAG: EF-hand domain-containing protein [Planctomycetes bacterium]|nr:EF-hand domain-containing protein [Planctomycetota bacterium]
MLSLKSVVLAAGIIFCPAIAQAALEPNAAADKKANKKTKKGTKKANKKGDQLATLFKKLDTNNDGKLSSTEFAKLKETKKANKANAGKKAKKTQKANKGNKGNKGKKGKKTNKSETLFKQLDTNKDGSLSLTEFKKLSEVQQAAKKTKKANKAKKKANK